MPARTSPLESLLERSLIVVTGKGGVGKTTVSGLLARAAARRGRKVLAVEADPRESLHRLFGVDPSDGATVAAGEGVALHHLRPRAAMEELVIRRLGSRWAADRVIASSAYRHFAEGAPGLKELAVFAWILARLRDDAPTGQRADTVVLDAPASGHAAAWLEAPRLVAEAIGGGPIATLARELAVALEDASRSAVVLVTLAEEMPVTESLELADRLAAGRGRRPDLVVVNGLLPEWTAPTTAAAPLQRMWSGWLRQQERERERLAERLAGPRIDLPRLAAEGGPELLAGLAAPMEEATHLPSPTPSPRGAAARSKPTAADAARSVGAAVEPGAMRTRREKRLELPPLMVVVGAGGVGKTTLAAAVASYQADQGADALVMTFDPSLRLRQALGLGPEALEAWEVEVALGGSGRLRAALLDARRTFDGLVQRYAPDPAAARRILSNRFYRHLAGTLAGVLEYMAVERLYEAATAGDLSPIVVDTPPARQALDFLDAPRRIVSFLDSGALKLGLKSWFDDSGRLRSARRLGPLGRRFEAYLDEVVGLDLLREMVEFFQAFAPLFAGFHQRALEVEGLLRSPRTGFLLVTTGEPAQVPDALYFARMLSERGMRLAGVVVNRVHPELPPTGTHAQTGDGGALLSWLASRDRSGLRELRRLLRDAAQVVELPLAPAPPTALPELIALGEDLVRQLAARPIMPHRGNRG